MTTQGTAIWRKAENTVEYRPIPKSLIRKRAVRLTISLLLSVGFLVVSLIAIYQGWPQREPTKILSIYLALLSFAIIVASIAGLALVLWAAYISTHFRWLEAQNDTLEAEDKYAVMQDALSQLGGDVTFAQEIRVAVAQHDGDVELSQTVAENVLSRVHQATYSTGSGIKAKA